jgi:alginate O-acetyltransferase complex protein AlgI
MLFCTWDYICFFVLVVVAYWIIPTTLPRLLDWNRVRVWLLIGASVYFYACWNRWLAMLVGATSFMDYLIALGMESRRTQSWRKALLVGSLVMNLGLLAYFKYANFFVDSFLDLLHRAGIRDGAAGEPIFAVILPVGISFYTFEAINYTVDVYRRKAPAERNLGHFLLFILFFPHLVAGPIVRARDFLPQIRRPKRISWPRIHLGCSLILLGVIKKLALADRMALYADPVFNDPTVFRTSAAWFAAVAYALQIYGDFSGYSDIAIGCAHILGYKLTLNFNMPYLSRNISEFWRRWHISLSTWLRDYLFIPLGGSRGAGWRTGINLLVTMTLGGLWHGANWTFVFWGIVHGAFLIIHRQFRALCQARPRWDAALETWIGNAARVAMTFTVVMLAFVLFRSSSVQNAVGMFQRMFVYRTGQSLPLHVHGVWLSLMALIACHWISRSGIWRRFWTRLPAPVLGMGYAVTLSVTLLLISDTSKVFIYFQF